MDRLKKIELINRTLALKHKLKVHDSLEQPATHEELSVADVAKWELQDELRAIEDLLREVRDENVEAKKKVIRAKIEGSRTKVADNKKSKK